MFREFHSLDATTSQEHVHSLHDIVLFRIVRVLFTGNLQNSGDCGVVIFQDVSDVISNVLVDENYTDVVAGGKILKGLFNLRKFGVLLDNQKVRRTCCTMSHTGQEETSDGVLLLEVIRRQRKVRARQHAISIKIQI